MLLSLLLRPVNEDRGGRESGQDEMRFTFLSNNSKKYSLSRVILSIRCVFLLLSVWPLKILFKTDVYSSCFLLSEEMNRTKFI